MTLEEIRKIAEKQWEGCHGCDDYDKQMTSGMFNGFISGYLIAME